MILPADNYLLLSLVNTKLRDKYSSFEELCGEEGADGEEIAARLKKIGYEYDEATNSFR